MCRTKMLLAAIFIFTITACNTYSAATVSKTALDRVQEQIKPGMKREDAVALLSKQAWYHQPCPTNLTPEWSAVSDLFFFENHDYDRAEIVIVTSYSAQYGLTVTDVVSFEPQIWQVAYENCLKREMFTP